MRKLEKTQRKHLPHACSHFNGHIGGCKTESGHYGNRRTIKRDIKRGTVPLETASGAAARRRGSHAATPLVNRRGEDPVIQSIPAHCLLQFHTLSRWGEDPVIQSIPAHCLLQFHTLSRWREDPMIQSIPTHCQFVSHAESVERIQ